MSQLHREFLLKATIHCPNQTQSCSILVPTGPAAVFTSVFYGTFCKEWRFLCQDFDITQNRLKNVRSLEVCTRHKNYQVSNRVQDPAISGARHDMLLKKKNTEISCLKCLLSLYARDKLRKRLKLECIFNVSSRNETKLICSHSFSVTANCMDHLLKLSK